MRGKVLLVAALLADAVILALVFATREPPPFSISLADFWRRDPRDQAVRVRGRLVHGSLCKVNADGGYRFAMQGARLDPPTAPHQLWVSYDGHIVPDTLRDIPGLDTGVLVEGERCQTCPDFNATQVMANGHGKYEFRPAGSSPLFGRAIPRCERATPRM